MTGIGCIWVSRGPLALAAAFAIALSAFGVASASQTTAGDRPEITGTPEVGQTLTSSTSADTGVFKWERCDPAFATCGDDPVGGSDWVHIAGANSQTYLVAAADAGFVIRVNTKGTSMGENFVASLPVGPVTGGPAISPTGQAQGAAKGQNLAAHHGQTVLIESTSGQVLIKVPGDTEYRPVDGLLEIPVGSSVDATHGTATITAERGDGTVDTANFWGGIFQAAQTAANNSYFEAKLAGGGKGKSGGNRLASAASGPVAHSAAAGKKLWGSGTGKFRTRGKGGAATLIGTTWLTKDTPAGTLFKVTEGHGIEVKDFGEKGLVTLHPGDKYFAQD